MDITKRYNQEKETTIQYDITELLHDNLSDYVKHKLETSNEDEVKKFLSLFPLISQVQIKEIRRLLNAIKKCFIVFPSSEDRKNLSVQIRKHEGGFLLKCLYDGGDDIYSRSCYFKCANEDLCLYKVVGTHEMPNSNKIVTERKNIQPQISIGSFDILHYLENTP